MTRHRFAAALLACCLLPGAGQPGWAIQHRAYSPERHDRFTGYPAAPAWNDQAWFDSRKFPGIGWAPADTPYQRQFALVSPQHLVCATHFAPKPGVAIRFLNSSGATVERTVVGLVPIQNELNQNTDLTVVTLASPVLPADQVAHFPYLNLAAEADYLDTALVVFGWHVRAGRGRLAGFDDLVEENGLNQTRLMRFDYWKSGGDPDDAYLEIGDSGSPSFAEAGGRPALVGIHATIEEDPLKRSGFDTFIPHYIGGLNTVLGSAGYQMTPAYPVPVSLAAAQTLTPATWRQANPGSCRFDLTNPSSTTATNVAVGLRFPPASVPDSLAAPGWIVTPGGAGEWELRRATLPAGTTVTITADWLNLGLGDSLNTELTLVSDGSARQRFDFPRQLAPSYAAWAVGLTNPAAAADDDGDGVENLQEYAFGGDPMVNSRTRPSGGMLLPVLRVEGTVATLEFPVREDATVRGLAYHAEFSAALTPGSWTGTPPPGMTVADIPYSPAEAGWRLRALSFDTAATGFCRVRVELDEDP
jgi:hypothetical protein